MNVPELFAREANTGFRGQRLTGIGLYGWTDEGWAAYFDGRAKFTTSGVATISAGPTSKTVTPNVNVISSFFVLLTPKVNLGGRDLWFTTNATANTFTIRMSRTRSSATKVAWLMLG